jgi:hypothetical protein
MNRRPLLLGNRERGLLKCTSFRKNRVDVECDTLVGRSVGNQLVVRCRNCGTDHVFVADGGRIVPLESRPAVRIASSPANSLGS